MSNLNPISGKFAFPAPPDTDVIRLFSDLINGWLEAHPFSWTEPQYAIDVQDQVNEFLEQCGWRPQGQAVPPGDAIRQATILHLMVRLERWSVVVDGGLSPLHLLKYKTEILAPVREVAVIIPRDLAEALDEYGLLARGGLLP